ncbi:hypothetical protein SRABI84_03369 [Peribacillus simplex]|uniref:hypothetical protein n=1 Tax=Peribacillus simplex TaxID=1478 RepID=UPI001D87D25C|nr:hypothetical protein [Peribacillus simplex]CAH0261243.1 hypothetical protein SRABI84_03369 [Peribacillus simplex]
MSMMKHHKKEKLANRLKNRRPQIIPFIIAFCGVMIITACSSKPSEETVEVKRETIFVQPETISFNKEMNQIDLTLTTNLPPKRIVDVTLNDSEGNYWGSDFDLAVNTEGKVKVEISPDDSPINGEYLVDLTLSVNGDDEDETENINEDFLFDSKVGGFSDELEEQYADSKEVTVMLEDEYNSFNYELKVSSTKPIFLKNGYTAEQAAQLEKEQSESAAAIEEDTSTDSSLDSAGTDDSYDSFQSELEYATGADWAEYTFDEKFIAVETILQAMEEGGTTITADTYWFIDALNAYYGDGTGPGGTERLVDMISLSGVSGGVIK